MRRDRTRHGFSLVELTLSIAMLVTLTLVLFGFLRTGMGIYRSGESRRDVYERAQILLDQIVRDFDAVAAGSRTPGVSARIAFLGDRDEVGRPRVRFVKALGSESTDEVLRLAGTRAGASAYVDLQDDLEEARTGSLLPTRGLMEVAYLTRRAEDGTTWLFRAVRSPIGGKGSLLDDAALPAPDEETPAVYRPLTSGVLFFGLRYRGGVGGRTEWTDLWDSTRGRLPAFALHRDESSLSDASDDVFPLAVELTLVLEEEGRGKTILTRAAGASSGSLRVNSTSLLPLEGDDGWVRVDDEWIRVAVQNGTTYRVLERGGRGSDDVPHETRARVVAGSRFTRTVPVPVGREVVE